MKKKILPLFLFLTLFFLNSAFANIPAPEDILGFKIGTARKLADMHQIVDYFKLLDGSSDRLVVREIGKTTEGNPFIVAIITSEANHEKLHLYQNCQQLLADPRKINDAQADSLIADGKTIVMINCSLHATEIGASQMSMQLAYDLLVSDDPVTREILDQVILLLVPMHNPDGIQIVVDWYKRHVGTKYEGCRMPWLYQKYVGHDNNRDWYMFTQKESRLTLKVHNAWHPQIVLDMHQMGSRGARLFVPPFVDPYEPNVDQILQQEVAVMGTFIASELTAQGKAGVMHSHNFDGWTPARAYHHYHGGIRILTECASVKIATPIEIDFDRLYDSVKEPSVKMPLPWKGGHWTFQDIIDYDYAAAKAALVNAARLRENWLRNFYRIHKKAVYRSDTPFAYLIPQNQRDLSAAVKMLEVLKLGDVEIHRAKSTFMAAGKEYETGTYIIFMAQPYGAFAKTLLENQVYPEFRDYPGGPLKRPYDVVAHTLPLLMGVERIQVDSLFEVATVKLEKVEKPKGKVAKSENGYGYIWSHNTNDDIIAMNRLIEKDYQIYWATESFQQKGKQYPTGTMIVKKEDGLSADLELITEYLWIHFEGLTESLETEVYEINKVKLGLYKPWTASMDEGWTRWVLEQYEIPFESVFNADIKNPDVFSNYDVIIIPDLRERSIINGISPESIPQQYAGGIGDEGVQNLKKFVQQGGTIITLNNAAAFAINQFELPIKDGTEDLKRSEFFVPGSILKAQVDSSHPIGYGYEEDVSLFFRRSPVFETDVAQSVVTYPDSNLLQSGWISGENYLVNRSALVESEYGKGKIILIGFPAQYRAQSHLTFRFLFNSIFYGKAEKKKL